MLAIVVAAPASTQRRPERAWDTLRTRGQFLVSGAKQMSCMINPGILLKDSVQRAKILMPVALCICELWFSSVALWRWQALSAAPDPP